MFSYVKRERNQPEISGGGLAKKFLCWILINFGDFFLETSWDFSTNQD